MNTQRVVKKSILLAACASFPIAGAVADTIITVKPEFSLTPDGRAIIVNAGAYCPDATYLYIDTTTATGKEMYSMSLLAHAANKELHFQTGCTCNVNCASHGHVQVYKICTVLTNSLCE